MGGGQESYFRYAQGEHSRVGWFYRCLLLYLLGTVQSDVVQSVRQLAQFRGKNFNLLNTAHIVLLPKRENIECIGDYRPVSLVHNIGKIFSKILASRLAPCLGEMVSSSQSAFVKKDASTTILSWYKASPRIYIERKFMCFSSSST
jgi:hypothetical protein